MYKWKRPDILDSKFGFCILIITTVIFKLEEAYRDILVQINTEHEMIKMKWEIKKYFSRIESLNKIEAETTKTWAKYFAPHTFKNINWNLKDLGGVEIRIEEQFNVCNLHPMRTGTNQLQTPRTHRVIAGIKH